MGCQVLHDDGQVAQAALRLGSAVCLECHLPERQRHCREVAFVDSSLMGAGVRTSRAWSASGQGHAIPAQPTIALSVDIGWLDVIARNVQTGILARATYTDESQRSSPNDRWSCGTRTRAPVHQARRSTEAGVIARMAFADWRSTDAACGPPPRRPLSRKAIRLRPPARARSSRRSR